MLLTQLENYNVSISKSNTCGRRVLAIMAAYTRRVHLKGVPFSGFRYIKGQVEVYERARKTVIYYNLKYFEQSHLTAVQWNLDLTKSSI